MKTVRKMYKRFLKNGEKYGGGNSVINQPFNTSLLGFAIAYVSDDEIRRKVECLELEKIEIDEKLAKSMQPLHKWNTIWKRALKENLRLMNRR